MTRAQLVRLSIFHGQTPFQKNLRIFFPGQLAVKNRQESIPDMPGGYLIGLGGEPHFAERVLFGLLYSPAPALLKELQTGKIVRVCQNLKYHT